MTKNRKNEISLMNVALCLFVIYIHAASGVMGSMNVNSWQYIAVMSAWKLASCAVPGFFFLSALKLSLSADKDGFSYPKYILSRIKRVWLPYAAAVGIYYLFFLYYNYMELDIPNALKLLFDGNMSAHFYFVIAAMQFYLLVPLWRWLSKKLSDPIFAVIAIISSYFVGLFVGQFLVDFIYIFYKGGVFPYSDRVFTTYIFWWILGLAAGRYYDRVKAALSRHLGAVSVLFVLAGVHNVFLTYVHNSGRTWIHWLDTAHVFYTVSAIVFMLALSTKLAKTKFAESFIVRYTDRASYSIYLWHPMALYISEIVVAGAAMPIGVLFGVRLLFAFVGTVTLCIAVAVSVDFIRRKLKTK